MSVPDQFAEIAPFYDELMSGVPYIWWVAYLEMLLDRFGASPTRVLEIACGTGSVTELVAANGYTVVGVDLSEPMVEIARKKSRISGIPVRYEAQDAAELSLGDKYDLAFSFFDSLNYISDPECLQRAFCRIAEHLEPDSLFIFDLNTEFALANRMFDQKETRRDRPLRFVWKSSYDEVTRLCRIDMRFWWKSGGRQRNLEVEHLQRAYTQEEILAMLDRAGFESVAIYESYTLKPPTRNTDRVHHVARLRGSL